MTPLVNRWTSMHRNQNVVEDVAIRYSETKDQIFQIPLYDIRNFRKLIQQQFADLSKFIYFDFVEDHPYGYEEVKELMHDFRSGVIKVNVSGNTSRLWSPFYNLAFRAIHDYIHCLHNLDFHFNHEVKAYHHQLDFSFSDRYTKKFPYMNWQLYANVLRSEIVYQAAVKTHFKLFDLDTQKIILTDL